MGQWVKKQRTRWQHLAAMGPRRALAHIWYYDHWWIIGVVLCILFVVAILPESEPGTSLGTCMIQDNLYQDGARFLDAALTTGGVDTEQFHLSCEVLADVGSRAYGSARTQVLVSAAADAVDYIVCGQEILDQLATLELFDPQQVMDISAWFEVQLRPVYLYVVGSADGYLTQLLLSFAAK